MAKRIVEISVVNIFEVSLVPNKSNWQNRQWTVHILSSQDQDQTH